VRPSSIPHFVRKAAVLVVRLAKNHPLPDDNKRVAWVALRVFIEVNGWSWSEHPSVDEAEHVVLVIASGEWDEERTARMARRAPRVRPGAVGKPRERSRRQLDRASQSNRVAPIDKSPLRHHHRLHEAGTPRGPGRLGYVTVMPISA
jgi:hypothetical protein